MLPLVRAPRKFFQQERHICQRCRPDLRKGLLPGRVWSQLPPKSWVSKMSLSARFVIVALPFLAVSMLRAGDFDLKFRPMPDGSEIRDVLIPTFDGLYVYGSIRKPSGTGPFAGVILIHGGTGGSRQATRGTLTQEGRLPAPVLVQAGYCLLSVDYRSRWVDEVQDILSGYRYFILPGEWSPWVLLGAVVSTGSGAHLRSQRD